MKVVFSLFIALVGFTPLQASQPTAWDLGVLALALHDLRAQESERDLRNIEDSRLNLSTLFDSVDGRGVLQLGHQKNTFNTISTSVAKYFADFYFDRLEDLEKLHGERTEDAELEARRMTVEYFIVHVERSFERATGLDFPQEPMDGEMSDEETVASLLGHDLLPGQLRVIPADANTIFPEGTQTPLMYDVADRSLDEHVLNHYELMQTVNGFDGIYDPAFLSFRRKEDGRQINLQMIDKMVIGMLQPDFPYEAAVQELADKKSLVGTQIAKEWISMMAKGINPVLPNGERDPFMP
jgi:hypothetical protein